jgi:hypothetical protein
MPTKKLILVLLLSSIAAPVLAAETAGPEAKGHLEVRRDGTMVIRADSITAAPDGTLIFRMRPVKNAPYSAQAIRERQQNLADGNQINDRRSPTAYYRDSAGRTRQEIVNDKGELQTVTINDPVANLTWILKPQQRIAIRIDRNRPAGADGERGRTEQTSKDGSLPPIERRRTADGMEEVIVRRVERVNPDPRQRTQEDVRIQVPRTVAENGTAMRDMGTRLAPLANAIDDARWSAKSVTKDLGTRDFGGIKAEGKLRSYEIPAGAIGNRNPIVVADETWTAPDLQVTVYTKHSDPRSGDFIFRLENVKREEPAAALFTVPADYTVREPDAHWRDKAGRADK